MVGLTLTEYSYIIHIYNILFYYFIITKPIPGETIAVDPKYIPLGSYVYIVANNGSWSYGPARAEDKGGAIQGDVIDLYMSSVARCNTFGVKKSGVTIYILR